MAAAVLRGSHGSRWPRCIRAALLGGLRGVSLSARRRCLYALCSGLGELVDNPRALARSLGYCLGSVALDGLVAALAAASLPRRRSLRPREEASALPQDPGQTKIRRKLLSQTRLIGESPTSTVDPIGDIKKNLKDW